MTDHLERWNRYLRDSIPDEHNRARFEFIKLNPAQRIEILKAWDAVLEDEIRPTREHAELIQKRRDMVDLHWQLMKVDR